MITVTSLATVGLLATAGLALPHSQPIDKRTISETGMIYNFDDIPSSADLHWTPCFDKYHCANLEVPLDYAEPDLGTTVVAWIRQDAINGTGQDIIFNPGGPGASGVNAVLSGLGDQIIIAAGGKYNLVSFDPRGVNNSGLALTCFPDDPDARDKYLNSVSVPGVLNELYTLKFAEGRLCSYVNENTTTKYGGTLAVAQDILHFTELQAAQDGIEKPEEAEVWFFGGSYGTIIGQTLAAAYPDRVGRIVVDSNVDGEAWYRGLVTKAAENVDKGLNEFFELCYKAGPAKCAFAGQSGSGSDIKNRFDNLLAKLGKAPLLADITQENGLRYITKTEVLNRIHSVLYHPMSMFGSLALDLASLEKDNATEWLETESSKKPEYTGPHNYTETAAGEVLKLVAQIDTAGRYPIKNVDDYLRVAAEIMKTSVYGGEIYAVTNPLINAGSTITPPESQYFGGFEKTKTKNPIFFINNSADPVTPLSSAKHMSQYFEGSIVLEQNAVGHGSILYKSACTSGYFAKYWDTAALPAPGTICETDEKPLIDSGKLGKRSEMFSHPWM